MQLAGARLRKEHAFYRTRNQTGPLMTENSGDALIHHDVIIQSDHGIAIWDQQISLSFDGDQ